MLARTSTRELHCPTCAGEQAHKLLYVKHGCDILRCEACGLGRADATSFDPNAYYTSAYFNGGHVDGYADYLETEPVLRREFGSQVEFIRGIAPTGGRLLELGCAYGLFLQEAKMHYEVVGVELAEDAAEHCRQTGLNVVTGPASADVLEAIGPVDVIVLLDVIEHLPDPAETLSICARQLRPGGVMVLTTGDFASPVARMTGSRWRLMTPPQHLWYFTPRSFRELAEHLGLTANIDHPWKIVPLSVVAFQLARMTGRKLPAPAKASGIGLPINLFDAMRVVLHKGARA